MGIKGGWKAGEDIYATARSLTKIGGGTLVEDGNFWRTDVFDPSGGMVTVGGVMVPTANTFYAQQFLTSAANTYFGQTFIKDGTILFQKHIVDEKMAVHNQSGFSFKDPDQMMAPMPPYRDNMSVQAHVIVGDDIGPPKTARMITDKDFQVSYLTSFVPITINSDGQVITDFSGETFDEFDINHGDLEIPHGILVTADALVMTGGSITSDTDPPSGPSTTPGLLNLRGTLQQNPDATTAVISSDIFLNLQAVTFYISRGTSPIDLNITGNITGNSGNLILTGAGIVRLGGNNRLTGAVQMAGTVTLNLGNDNALGTAELDAGSGALTSDTGTRTLSNTLRITGSLGVTGANPIVFTSKAYLIGSQGEQRMVTVNPAGSVLTFAGGLSESQGAGIGLVKNGAGTLRFLSASDFSGGTEVLAGILLVDGTLLNDKPVLVNGGTLTGSGSVGPVTALGGTVAPGTSGTGKLTTAGTTLGQASTLSVGITGSTPGTKYAQVVSGGVVAITSMDGSPARFPVLSINFPTNFQSNVGDQFTLVVNNTLNPIQFSQSLFQSPDGKVLPEGATFTPVGAAAAQLYQITYQAGPNKNNIAITRVNAPPANVQLTVTPTALLVGNQVTLTGTFTDPDTKDTHTVLINWGDGTTTNISLGMGVGNFGPLTHTYTGAASPVPPGQASLVITATVTDNSGASAVGHTTVTVVGIGSAVGQFDPTTGNWYLRNSPSAGGPDAGQFLYGLPTWSPVTGDWNGDRVTTVGVVDPVTVTWYLRNENSAGGADAGAFKYGVRGWTPVTGDWNGTGTTGIGMFDPKTATWYLRSSPNAGAADAGIFQFGSPGWIPVTGDWSGTGKTGIGVVDPKTMTWYLKSTPGAGAPTITPFQFGGVGFKVVTGNWNGDGRTQAGVVSPAGVWYLRTGTVNSPSDVTSFPYGLGNWTPVSGVWQLPALPKRAQGQQASAASTPLSQADLDATVASVLARLGAEGVDAATLGQLASMQFHVGNLTGGLLGVASASSNGVVLDAGAAGFGWYTGSADALDGVFTSGGSDFLTAVPGGPAAGRMDLQTAVLVEMGRLAGLEQSNSAAENALLASVLEPGIRLTNDLSLIRGGQP
jgi:autotransporter-associated beta strand protein